MAHALEAARTLGARAISLANGDGTIEAWLSADGERLSLSHVA